MASRRYSDAELDAALGEPPEPTTLDDVHTKVVELLSAQQIAHETNENILRVLCFIAVLGCIALYKAFPWW